MKNLIYLFFAVALSCGCTKSQEELIKEEFNNYVRLNFDDPNSVEEILFVSEPDTLTFDSIMNMGKSIVNDFESIIEDVEKNDSLWSEQLIEMSKDQQFLSYIRNNQESDPFVKKYIELIREEYSNIVLELSSAVIPNYHEAKDELKYILSDTTIHYSTFIKRSIRYRQITNEGKKVDSLFYFIKNNGTPYFTNKDVEAIDFNEKCEDISLGIRATLEEMCAYIRKREKQIEFDRVVDVIRERAYPEQQESLSIASFMEKLRNDYNTNKVGNDSFYIPSFFIETDSLEIESYFFKVFKYEEISIIRGFSFSNALCFDDEFPIAGTQLDNKCRILRITYYSKKGIFSGHTTDGRIFYLKKRINLDDCPHPLFYGIIYPKRYGDAIKIIINHIKDWSPDYTYDDMDSYWLRHLE